MKKTKSKKKSYYLPDEVISWISKEAKKQDRSASNFLSTIIKKLIDEEKII